MLGERDDAAAASHPGASGASLSGRYSRRAAFGGDYGQRLLALLQGWRSSLFERMARTYTILETVQSYPSFPTTDHPEPPSQSRFDLFQPPLGATCPPGSPFVRLGGEGDGGKWLCAGSLLNSTGCVIYSVGSNDQWEFEDAMLAETPCEVHTFDCTSPAKTRGPRHHFHPVCVGVPREGVQCSYGDNCRTFERVRYRSWEQITAALGHDRVDLLKVDIEGFEYDFFASLQEATGCALPSQIAVEIHYRRLYNDESVPPPGVGATNLFRGGHVLSLAELSTFAAHLANLGYLPVGREPNPEGMDCCSEFTLLRAEEPFACRAVPNAAAAAIDLLDDGQTNLTRAWDVNVSGAVGDSFWTGFDPSANGTRRGNGSADERWTGSDVRSSTSGAGRQGGGIAAGSLLIEARGREAVTRATAEQVAAALGNVSVDQIRDIFGRGSGARSADEENPRAHGRADAGGVHAAGTRGAGDAGGMHGEGDAGNEGRVGDGTSKSRTVVTPKIIQAVPLPSDGDGRNGAGAFATAGLRDPPR